MKSPAQSARYDAPPQASTTQYRFLKIMQVYGNYSNKIVKIRLYGIGIDGLWLTEDDALQSKRIYKLCSGC